MAKRTVTYAQVGTLFATSGQVPYLTMTGAGAAIGLVLGAGVDRDRAGQR